MDNQQAKNRPPRATGRMFDMAKATAKTAEATKEVTAQKKNEAPADTT